MNSKKYLSLLMLPILALTSCAKSMTPEEVKLAYDNISKSAPEGDYISCKMSSNTVVGGVATTNSLSALVNKKVGSKLSFAMAAGDTKISLDITALNEENIAYVKVDLSGTTKLSTKNKISIDNIDSLMASTGMTYNILLSMCDYSSVVSVIGQMDKTIIEGLTGKQDGDRVTLSYKEDKNVFNLVIENNYIASYEVKSGDEEAKAEISVSSKGTIAAPSDASSYQAL